MLARNVYITSSMHLRIAPLIIWLFIFNWNSSAHARGLSCSDLFFIQRVQEKGHHVFSSQTSVGKAYAEIKLLKKAGFRQHRNLDELPFETLQKVIEYFKIMVTQEIPAVVSPSGKLFIIDANHDIFGAVLLGLEMKSLRLNLVIQKDYQKTNYSEEAFIADMVAKGWGEREALESPHTVDQLSDNPRRSLMGLVFSHIEESQGFFINHKGNPKSNVPFQGKHFSPRIQFRLIDILARQGILPESPSLAPEFVKHIAEVILNNPATLRLLMDSLQPQAPAELVLFLKLRIP